MGQLTGIGSLVARVSSKFVADKTRRVIVEGVEHVTANGPVFILEGHTHHFDDAILCSQVIMGAGGEPPALVIGENLYRHPGLRLLWNTLGYIPIERGDHVMPAYRNIWDTLEGGRSVWQSNTPGLAKNGCIQTAPGIVGVYRRASNYRTMRETLERHPIVPVATNSAHLIGEELRAIRDARGKWPSFDSDMLAAYRKQHAGETIIRFGEPIRVADTPRAVVAAIDATIVGEHPIFPEDYAAFGLALSDAYDAPLDAVPRAVHNRVEDHEEFLLRLREQHGEAVFQAALRQRVGPLDSRFVLHNIASVPRKIDFIAAEIERYVQR